VIGGQLGCHGSIGHVDSRSGPGIFFRLRSMRPGKRIYVRRSDGTLAIFTVRAVRTYARSQFPAALVYGRVPDAELAWSPVAARSTNASGSYLSNVLVYAQLSG
jgi:hypothetical protein